ncbi:hypothetical protein PIB30_072721 [Stylosanthes scabra]|uniref:Uncharacterized protein n=1 Tax=Stylosanthes scabra TaxID=79078 RepID=A0ABU6TNT7_9FABA|nr:hypothetical protein [Stylosanthes scabra]
MLNLERVGRGTGGSRISNPSTIMDAGVTPAVTEAAKVYSNNGFPGADIREDGGAEKEKGTRLSTVGSAAEARFLGAWRERDKEAATAARVSEYEWLGGYGWDGGGGRWLQKRQR